MNMKAIGLLSGGLDSTLAVRMIVDQGVEVIAVKFTSPFCQCDSGGCCHAAEQARRMGIPLKTFAKGDDYLEVVRHPKHGWGSGINPCIDCRIFMLKKTVEYMREIGASFLFTGEVLGQRPMSQHRRALNLIERESGLVNKILRPLSAQLLPPTEAELNGWVDRAKLLAVSGRSRKPQMALAKELEVTDTPCPAVLLGEPTPEAIQLACDATTAFAGVEGDTLAVRRLTQRSDEVIQTKRVDRETLKHCRV